MQTFKTESKKILDLVINAIYSSKEVFLRELISNASDAIDKLVLEVSSEGGEVQEKQREIELSFDADARTITVRDFGIGMTRAQMEHDLGTIAHSSSLEAKRLDEAIENENVDIIGQFGVGFYSSFMVADEVTVTSRAYGSEEAYVWHSDGIEGFTIEPGARDAFGTDVVLHLRADDAANDYSKFLSYPALEELVKRYSNYVRYPICMETSGVREVPTPLGARNWEPQFEEYIERRILNSMIPIWSKPRAEVTDEEYNEFYMEAFQDKNPPLRIISLHARGGHSCDILLFIPSEPPADYFSSEYKKGLSLYSSGVLIDERNEAVIPEYLGFVRGIVDSPDISLNLSREGVQDDPFIQDIARQIDKRLLAELAAMRDEEREVYIDFFGGFGRTFKFAIYATFGAMNELLEDYLLFFTALKDEPITLREYRDAMPVDQPCVLFASGDEAGKLEASPSVKHATDLGFDVLLCTEGIDELALMTLRTYDNIAIKNVASDDLVLDSREELEAIDVVNAQNADLFAAMVSILPTDVVEVCATGRLSLEPACISSKGPISLGMEKYFAATSGNGNAPKIQHVLEVNPNHAIFEHLKGYYAAGDAEKVVTYTRILYGQAMLSEGLQLADMSSYSQAVYSLM